MSIVLENFVAPRQREFARGLFFDRVSWPQAICIAYVGALIRTMFESWIYKGGPPSFVNNFIHFPLSFICFALCIAALASFIANYPADKACKLILTLLPVIALVPLIDLLVYGAKVRGISYLYPDDNPALQFVRAVFTRHYAEQISVGQLVIVHGTAIAVALVSWRTTRNIVVSLLNWVGVLAVIYFWATFPLTIRQIVQDVHHLLWYRFVGQELPVGNLSEQNSILGSPDAVSSAIFILSIPCIAGLLALCRIELLRAVFANLRLTRMLHYSAMLGLGMILALRDTGDIKLLLAHPANLFAIALLFQSVAAAFAGAVWLNDVYDLRIDSIVHKNRPVASGQVTPEVARQIAAAFGLVALTGAALLGSNVLLIMVMAWAASFAYSAPPLRLRRFFPISLLLLSCISVLLVQAGYLFAGVGIAESISSRTAIGLILGYSLLLSFKDISDVEGDSSAGVTTLATLFPGSKGRLLSGAAVLLGAIVSAQALLPGMKGLACGGIGGIVGMSVLVFGKSERLIFLVYFAVVGTVLYGLFS